MIGIEKLIEKYLESFSEFRDYENDSINIINGEIHTWNFSQKIPRPTNEQLQALSSILEAEAQDNFNKETSRQFLKEADWKRNRHISQKALGITTSLSDEEYLEMETECQACREIL